LFILKLVPFNDAPQVGGTRKYGSGVLLHDKLYAVILLKQGFISGTPSTIELSVLPFLITVAGQMSLITNIIESKLKSKGGQKYVTTTPVTEWTCYNKDSSVNYWG
jgi:hypothetical protein